MMNLILGILSITFLIFFSLDYFWVMNLLLIFFLFYFFLEGFSYVDYFIYSMDISMDSLSLSLIILSIWVSIVMIISSSSIFNSSVSPLFFSFLVVILLNSLIFSFSTVNLFSFYFFFEFSLIPTLLIIMGWGYQPERLQAGLYFLFYTLTASLPLFFSLFYSYKNLGGLDFFTLDYILNSDLSMFYFLCLTLAFLVKLPMFFTHLWLPKAHVEAPVSGSMILAGVLLKLGGYGLIRVSGLFSSSLGSYSSIFYGVSISGMVFVGFICCRLNDIKALVAYSSVAHMGLVICGILNFYIYGFSGSLLLMISHGLCSSGLFCMVNFYYERLGSRSFFLNKGLITVFPVFTLLFFLLSVANIAAPPTINLMSEIFLMISILKFDKIMFLLFPLGSYLGAVFTLFMFSFSQHGKFFGGSMSSSFCFYREFHLGVMHILPLNFLILKSEYLMFML